MCTSESWLDPSTFRIAFDITNKAASATVTAPTVQQRKLLRPLSGGWCFFQRLRILCGGTIVEDITDFARTREMFSLLMAKDSKVNADAEGFGLDPFNYKTAKEINNFPGISEGESQTIMFTPLSGLLSQQKYVPVRKAALTFELELISNYTDPFVLNNVAGEYFTEDNTSNEWVISNVQAKCDIITLDNELENSYTQLLMSGKTLPINYSTYITQFRLLVLVLLRDWFYTLDCKTN